jgi:hypothetical protein
MILNGSEGSVEAGVIESGVVSRESEKKIKSQKAESRQKFIETPIIHD